MFKTVRFYKILVVVFILTTGAFASQAHAAGEFITTWDTTKPGADTDNPNTAHKEITIPTFSDETYDYDIDWGDGTTEIKISSNIKHTYTTPGTYQVKISGTFPRIFFNNYSDRQRLISVDQWGDIQWKSMAKAFMGATNLEALVDNPAPSNAPNLSDVTDMTLMFYNNQSLNQGLSSWDVSHVNIMNQMFSHASAFDGDLSLWDVSNVIDMSGMFWLATSFNQNINSWGSKVSKVTNMNGMFLEASAFNQHLNAWHVVNVTDMANMFHGATSFNRPLHFWDVSHVTTMNNMFHTATSFNQNLALWNVRNVTNLGGMFNGVTLSTTNYDALLTGWSTLPVQHNLSFNGGSSRYSCAAVTPRGVLTSTPNSWTIADGGLTGGPCGGGNTTADTTAPTFSSATVNVKNLTATYSETLDSSSVPVAGTFVIKVNGISLGTSGISSRTISGSNVIITLSASVGQGSTVTYSYTKPNTGSVIKDLAGNMAAGTLNRSVTNNTPSTTSNSNNTGNGGGSGGGGGSNNTTHTTTTTTNTTGMTNAQLLALIKTLQAQLTSLIAQIAARGGTVPAVTNTNATYTRNLTIGSTGADVTALQLFLERKGYLITPAGGSRGGFGALTQNALARYQAANNIQPAVGFFGPLTRAYIISHP